MTRPLPRLTRALRDAALLTPTEAAGVIRAHRNGHPAWSEAAQHYTAGTGDTRYMIGRAIACRHARRMHR